MNKKWPFKIGEVMGMCSQAETPFVAIVKHGKTGQEWAIGVWDDYYGYDGKREVNWWWWEPISVELSPKTKPIIWSHEILSGEYISVTELLKALLHVVSSGGHTGIWLKRPMALEELEKLRETKEEWQ